MAQSLVVLFDAAVHLGVGALLLWRPDICLFALHSDNNATTHNDTMFAEDDNGHVTNVQFEFGLRLLGVVLSAIALFVLTVWLLARKRSLSKTYNELQGDLLSTVFIFIPLIWLGILGLSLAQSNALTSNGLIVLIATAITLVLLNIFMLMVSCWPSSHAEFSNRVTRKSPASLSTTRNLNSINSVNGDDDCDIDEESGDVPLLRGSLNADHMSPPDATSIANDNTKQRAVEEAVAKVKRERGYGTGKLLELAKPHRIWLYAGCAVLLLRLPFSLSMPHWVSQTIGALIDKNWSEARWNVTYLCIAGVCDSILDFWCVYLFGLAQQKIIRSLRLDLFAAILKQEVGFFDITKIGEITSRLTADTAEMANDLTWVFRFTIEALVRIGGILGYMMLRSWRLGLMALAIIPITATINRFYATWMHKNSKQVQTALADANVVAEEVISSIRTVFSFAMEVGEHQRYSTNIEIYYVLVVKQIFVQGVYYMVCNTFLINTCVQAALLFYGTYLVASPTVQMEPTVLLAFMLYQGQLQEYFQNLLNSFTSLIKSSGAAAKVFEYIDRQPRYKNKRSRFNIPTSIVKRNTGNDHNNHSNNNNNDGNNDDNNNNNSNGVGVRGTSTRAAIYEDSVSNNDSVSNKHSGSTARVDYTSACEPMSVTVRDVHFCYPSRPKVKVLSGLNLTATPGQVVALVGSSGSGKSTCFHLIEHFYEPQIGMIMINGKDITTLDHEWLHHRVALVGQEPTLLAGSIADNIMYGLKDFTHDYDDVLKEQMIVAAKEANAHDFIMQLPDAYETQVGERGVQLSGGQKQRIAIARCLIRNPSILLLDEATSALDAESEAVVQEALERAMKNRTTLVIAHRLSTVKNAHKIVMLHKGKIVETGTHEELMANTGNDNTNEISYRSLVHRQTLK